MTSPETDALSDDMEKFVGRLVAASKYLLDRAEHPQFVTASFHSMTIVDCMGKMTVMAEAISARDATIEALGRERDAALQEIARRDQRDSDKSDDEALWS